MKLKYPLMNADAGAAGGGGAGTGGAPAGAGTGDGGAPAAGAPVAWHTNGFDQETQGWIQNRGLDKLPMDKALPEVIKGFRGAEKLIGAPSDRVLKLPGDNDAPEAWNQVYDRLGRPTDAKGYEIPVPEGQDKTFAESMRPVFHELGLSAKQAKGLAEKWNAAAAAHQAEQVKQYEQRATVEAEGLKKEWGAAHDKEMQKAKGAAKAFGMTGEVIDALESVMGYAGVMKFLAKAGSALGEDKFHAGGNGSGGFGGGVMTPAQAQAAIAAKKQDAEFVKRYTQGGTAEKQEVARLHAMAYPDAQ